MLLIRLAYPSENSYIYKTVLQAEPKNGNSSTLISVKIKNKNIYTYLNMENCCVCVGARERQREKGAKKMRDEKILLTPILKMFTKIIQCGNLTMVQQSQDHY